MTRAAAWALAVVIACGLAQAQDPTDLAIKSAVERAARARDQNRKDDVKREVMGAANLAGGNPRYLRVLAADLLDYGFPELALQVSSQSLARAPDDPVLHGILGIAQFKAHKYTEAIAELTIATAKQPDRKEWWLALARAHLQANQEAAALADIEKARALSSDDDVDMLEVKAECEYRNMHLAQCEETCRTLLSKDPKNPMGWQLLIRVRRTQGKLDDARKAADDALKAMGRHPEIVLESGLVLLAQGKNEDAVKELKDVAAQLPNDPRPQLHLCKAYTRLGMAAEAKAAKARYAELSPDLKPASADSRRN